MPRNAIPHKIIDSIETKWCNGCKEWLPADLNTFQERKDIKSDGLTSHCRQCELKRHRDRYPENKEKIAAYAKKSYAEHPERYRATSQRYRDSHPEKMREWSKRALSKKRSTTRGKLNDSMGNGIRQSLCGSKGKYHWEDLTGYSVEQLKKHLEKQFKEGMSWERFMSGEIHIDHKIPIAAFNFHHPKDIDFQKCWSLKNLQPLWAHDNLVKQAKLNQPFQPSLLLTCSL